MNSPSCLKVWGITLEKSTSSYVYFKNNIVLWSTCVCFRKFDFVAKLAYGQPISASIFAIMMRKFLALDNWFRNEYIYIWRFGI
jgi:hypothetical protein